MGHLANAAAASPAESPPPPGPRAGPAAGQAGPRVTSNPAEAVVANGEVPDGVVGAAADVGTAPLGDKVDDGHPGPRDHGQHAALGEQPPEPGAQPSVRGD